MNDVNVSVNKQSIVATTQGNTVAVAVNSGIGPQGAPGPAGATDYAQLTNKPASFPPSAHTHVIADVTGLQTALDGKQATGSYVVTTDSRLADSREWSAATVSQADAEAGSSTSRFAFTPQRIFQAIAAWWAGSAAKTKLDTIDSGATSNQTDAYLLSRANHTGTQAIGTVDGLQTALDGKAASSHSHGSLTSDGKIGTTAGRVVVTGANGSLTATPFLSGDKVVVSYGQTDVSLTGMSAQFLVDIHDMGTVDIVDYLGAAPTSHSHGNITSDGKIGTTSGQIVVTGTGGALTTLPAAFSSLALYDGANGENVLEFVDQYVSWTGWSGYPEAFRQSIGAAAVSHAHSASDISGLASIATSGSASDLGSGTVPIARIPTGTTSATICIGNDARLSDTRTPTDGSVTDAKITSGGLSTSSLNWAAIADWQPSTAYNKGDLVNYLGVAYRRSAAGTSGTTFNSANWQQITPSTGSTSSTLCIGNDSRLSNARTPTSHASTHQTGGSDSVSNVVVSPSQITGNQNDYAPGTGDVVRLSSDAARTITGITAGGSGDVRVLVNVGSFTITLSHQSASSTAANRFLVSFGADYLLAANAAAVIVYDATTSRWRVI